MVQEVMTQSCLYKVANYGIGGHYEPHHDFIQVSPRSGIHYVSCNEVSYKFASFEKQTSFLSKLSS